MVGGTEILVYSVALGHFELYLKLYITGCPPRQTQAIPHPERWEWHRPRREGTHGQREHDGLVRREGATSGYPPVI